MQFPIVREYRDDILNRNPENEIRGEPFSVEPGEWTRVIVPRHSPFFVKSLKLYFANGEPMEPGVHFQIWRIMPKLTGLAAQGVSCMIELLDDNITEGLMDYDVVGEFSLFDNTMMYLIMGAVNDDRPIDWNNLHHKPLFFPPTLHKHSLLYDVMAFQDLIDLLDLIVSTKEAFGRPLIQVKIDHYFDLFNNYLTIFKSMLVEYINNHVNAYNSHGLTDVQVGLEKVDNFRTASTMADIMSGRNDLHMTVSGLKTIIEQTGFDANEFLAKDSLPIAQYGNTNFIPPSIDGSFEGLGGISETAGISMESDGTVVFLSNRMDGRVSGLYYSTFDKLWTYGGNKMKYTSFRYTHQKFEQDGASVDRIAQGSGSEVILVANNRTNHYYIGLTNGTLDPTKHVYSRLDLSLIFNLIRPGDPAAARDVLESSSMFQRINIALMGDWIYVFFAHNLSSPGVSEDSVIGDARYKHIYRVRKADVAAQIDVALEQQTVSFQDIRGNQFNNAPFWRWDTPVGTNATGYTHYIFDFSAPTTQMAGCYRSQQTTTAAHRDKPGKYLVRFTTYYWCRYNSANKGALGVELTIEILYEFDPVTNTFTKLKNTPIPYIDWEGTMPVWNNTWASLTAVDREQGLAVLEDGSIIASGGRYPGYPRLIVGIKSINAVTRFEAMEKLWYNELQTSFVGSWEEEVLSPITSSIKPRSMLFTTTGSIYTAGLQDAPSTVGLFAKTVSGRLISRPEVSNRLLTNVVSQPLTNNIKRINAEPRIGGANVSVPTAQLSNYGMDIGDSAFCTGMQGKYYNAQAIGAYWGATPDPEAIRIFGSHNLIQESNGTLSIQPTSDIIYPAAIVNQFKREVQFPALMDQTPNTAVTITDPTGRLTDKFGWLPVLVTITYSPTFSIDVYSTTLSIVPVYSVSGTTRTVTGYTVLDRVHLNSPGNAPQSGGANWVWYPGGAVAESSHGVARTGYYLDGNTLSIVVDPGVQWSGPGDSLRPNTYLRYPDRNTQRWGTGQFDAYIQLHGNTGFTHYTVLPDSGPSPAWPYDQSTGGAATIYRGVGNNPLLASVYPEVGWVVFFQTSITAIFNGKPYVMSAGNVDLRDFDADPTNKTFYIYVKLENGVASYDVTQEKRFETPFQLWVAKVVTNDRQIITIERYNVFTINGNRVSEIKRGNSIPGSSGLVNTEGQLPWLRSSEMLP